MSMPHTKLPVIDAAAQQLERTLLARADWLLLLSSLLAAPTPVERSELEPDTLARLLEYVGFVDGQAQAELLLSSLQDASAVDTDDWASEYQRLFGPELACPIYETAYVRRDKGVMLSDASGFYRAFGFAAKSGERPDHLCAQLEFSALLHISLAHARAQGDSQASEVVADALNAFLADHLGEWLTSFACALTEASTLPFYRALGQLLLLTASALGCAAQTGQDHEPLAPSMADTPYECGLVVEAPAEQA